MPRSRRPVGQPVPSASVAAVAFAVFASALELFVDDDAVDREEGTFLAGTHFRETETLALRLRVSAELWGMEIVRKADFPMTERSLRLLAIIAPFGGSVRLSAFEPGPWQAELLRVVH